MAGGPPLQDSIRSQKSISGRVDHSAVSSGFWHFARDDLLLYFTAILGIILPGCMYMVYSKAFTWWHTRRQQAPFGDSEDESNAKTAPKPSSAGENTANKHTETSLFEAEKRRVQMRREESGFDDGCAGENDLIMTINVFFASETGTAKDLAVSLVSNELCTYRSTAVDLATVDPDAFISTEGICIFIASTFVDGEPPDKSKWFFDFLADASQDFRYGSGTLSKMKFAVFGLGNSMYEGNYNTVGKRLHETLKQLGARPFMSAALSDESKSESIQHQFSIWTRNVLALISNGERLERACAAIQRSGRKVQKVAPKVKVVKNKKKAKASDSEAASSESENEADKVMDLEDIVPVPTSSQNTTSTKEMANPVIRASLTKQGYKIVGSHSAVKLCRWTKASVRGRGGCYKHTFYGIESHQCMEATPSLACANKCVFCWRHHSNPVGTEWKWSTDEPEVILDGILKNHLQMVRQLKGVPGADPERLRMADSVRHCALSLVGEPIMYPKINQLVEMLHQRRISTFMVTNAQFPEQIRNLLPVTQLYVSVDAPTKDALKKVDRPLFTDFWDRLLECLDALREKKQRTVYRLTLVKDYNTEDIGRYAELIQRGQPDFVEVKGVTYCGTSAQSKMTMQNVPWHEEVRQFVLELSKCLDPNTYAVACEHEHTNCLLIAHNKFLIDGRWHTWIDYDRFFELANSQRPDFSSLDYSTLTPDWAVFGAPEQGFDPDQTRFFRKKKVDKCGNGEQSCCNDGN